jgi:AraC-like DNA-binding protein
MIATTRDFSSFRFSTEGLPSRQRLPKWHEALDRAFGGRRVVSPRFDGPFHVEMSVRRLGRAGNRGDTYAGACVVRMAEGICGSLQRTPEPPAGGNEHVVLLIQETGRRIVSQLGREAAVDAGAGLLLSNAETCRHVFPEPSSYVCIGVPRKLMMALAPGLDDTLLRPLPPDEGILRLLRRYVDVLEDEHVLKTPELQRTVTTHIYDLFALAIGATRDTAEIARGRGLRAARLCTIKTDIAQNLMDGDVSALALAMRHRVTPRYIHKLFESEGATLSRFVLGQRLARAHRLLTDPRYSHRTISALAFDVGFGDLSTFNRQFRRHYGATPSDVRAAAAITRPN